MAFLSRYRTLRQVDGTESDEVEYNFGRAFQQLGKSPRLFLIRVASRSYCWVGLHSLAVKHYERVLDIVERRTRTNPDVGPTFSPTRGID